jgi:hypothetical protein
MPNVALHLSAATPRTQGSMPPKRNAVPYDVHHAALCLAIFWRSSAPRVAALVGHRSVNLTKL